MNISCPSCGASIAIPDEVTSGSVTCPQCGSATLVAVPEPRMTPPTQHPFGAPMPPPQGRSKGLAIAALVMGIPGACFFPLGLVAIVVGIMALVKSSRRPDIYGGSAMAIVGMIAGASGLVVGLLIAILLPSLARARELSKRTVCTSNLKGIGTGFYTNATESSDRWWNGDFPKPGSNSSEFSVDYTQSIGSYRSTDLGKTNTTPERLSTTRGFWQLVRRNVVTPRIFYCPSTGDDLNSDDNPASFFDFGTETITGPATPQQSTAGWKQVSYGLQVPFGEFGQPSSDLDARMILVADKGPYGAAIENNLAAPPPIPTNSRLTPDDLRSWNSPNHGGLGDGEGQVALFADSHAEFITVPWGPFKDNIYTAWPQVNSVGSVSIGRAPAPGLKLMPASNTDSLIYP